MKEKAEQTKKSDNLNLTAYVVVVEFSQPLIKSGNPPEEIAEELREAWRELVGFFQQEAA